MSLSRSFARPFTMLLALWQVATMLALVWPVNAVAQPDADSRLPGISCHGRHIQSAPAPSETRRGCCHFQHCSDQCGQQLPVIGSALGPTLLLTTFRAEPRPAAVPADQRPAELFRPPINFPSLNG